MPAARTPIVYAIVRGLTNAAATAMQMPTPKARSTRPPFADVCPATSPQEVVPLSSRCYDPIRPWRP